MRARPYVTAFLICERVLQEKDGVLSAIRIIDVIGVPELSVDGGQQFFYQICMLIVLKSGDFKGACRIALKGTRPSGKQMPIQQLTVALEGGNRGNNTIVQANMSFQEEGDYWFEVWLNDEFVTKTPLSVVLAPKKNEEPSAQEQPAHSPSPKAS